MKVYEGKNGKVENYMKENYRLVEPKIAAFMMLLMEYSTNPEKGTRY